ncbi:MAG: hypothetical protein WStaBPW_19820 [Shewanella algae]
MWYPVNGHHIHEVHHEYPHENSQSKRCYQGIATMECIFNAVVDKLDDHFDKALKLTGNARSCLFANAAEQPQKQHAKTNRKEQ